MNATATVPGFLPRPIRGILGTVAVGSVLLLATLAIVSEVAFSVGLLAVAVAVVGMPHGGLDHLVGRAVFQPLVGRFWAAWFLSGYLLVAALVVVGWWLLPLVTIVLFFTASAFHFGETEVGGRWVSPILGGMAIWMPILARPGEVSSILGCIVPRDIAGDLADVTPSVLALCLALAIVSVGWWVLYLATSIRRGRTVGIAHSVRLAAFAAMFIYLPVLVSFSIYFCAWHSSVELIRLSRQYAPGDLRVGLILVIRRAAPLSLIAVAGIAAFALIFYDGRGLAPATVQAVFIGLSAVAIPHMLLHRIASIGGLSAGRL